MLGGIKKQGRELKHTGNTTIKNKEMSSTETGKGNETHREINLTKTKR